MTALPRSDMDVWVLAGQSNMQGCGWLEGALGPDERVWAFSSAGEWQTATEPLHKLWDSYAPVHQDLMRPWLPQADKDLSDAELARRENATRTVGAGLGIAFGQAMAGALGQPIGLIAAAHGGTSLDQWSPALKHLGGRSLYGAMLDRIARAGGRLRGILWYQGESDATTIDLGRTYADRFAQWISAVRVDTGMPDLPVIAVQIGRVIEPPDRAGVWPGWDLVREALRMLPHRIAATAVTSSVDLPLVDLIHINTPGLVRLGHRLARQALRLTGHVDALPGPWVERAALVRTPHGMRNGLRVSFGGLTGKWVCAGNLRGFEVRLPDPAYRPPLYVVDAWVDPSDGVTVNVLLNREADSDAKLGYGLGINPVCDLVDEADMPLCSFLPIQVE